MRKEINVNYLLEYLKGKRPRGISLMNFAIMGVERNGASR